MSQPEIQRAMIIAAAAHRLGRGSGLELFSTNRAKANDALSRQIVMYCLHVFKPVMTYEQIGEFFGRDRTTVSHAIQVVEDHREDPDFDKFLEQLEEVLNSEPFCLSFEPRDAMFVPNSYDKDKPNDR